MNQAEESRYITAYARIIGVQEARVTEYAQRKGLAALVDNAYQLLETPEQQAKHKAFLELYRMSSTAASSSSIPRSSGSGIQTLFLSSSLSPAPQHPLHT
ncbi:MAG: hypothetical protein QM233_03835 [Candidatus Cloacimonadota bacterium]|nr:hypothetical protein [Candidatus Cloacimonadota bacterium]